MNVAACFLEVTIGAIGAGVVGMGFAFLILKYGRSDK